jgi:hypothetical protein
MNRETDKSPLDRQITALGGQLREQGMPPGRDLWPAIDQAIARQQQPAPRPWPAFWRVASLAASLAMVLGLGYVGTTGGPDRSLEQAALPGEMALAAADRSLPASETRSSLEHLDTTLGELNTALSRDPGNAGLSRLVLLVHRSRADVLRQSVSGNTY